MPDSQRPRSEQRQRRVMLAARVNPEEERRIREAAKAQRISVASLIRKAVLAAVDQQQPSAEEGAVTQWGVRYTARQPRGGTALTVIPIAHEQTARETAASARRNNPEADDVIVRRQVGPWKEVPDA